MTGQPRGTLSSTEQRSWGLCTAVSLKSQYVKSSHISVSRSEQDHTKKKKKKLSEVKTQFPRSNK